MARCTQDQRRRRPDDHHRRLPNDVLIDILTRLPVKSLLRCKCVCKNWYDLIQNPSFAHAHFRLQKLQDKGRIFFQYLRFRFVDDDTSKYRYALFPDETLASDACHDIDFLETPPLAFIYGPVNGLFCVMNNDHRFIIWNPAIREFRILPDHLEFPPNLDVVNLCSIFSGIGFGFDKATDYYKVVLIRHFRVKDTPVVNDISVHVYSLSTNTWRHLNCLDYLSPEYLRRCSTCSGNGAYSDGVYYWWAGTGILAFDMGNEVFRVISVPFILPVEFDKCDVKPYNGDRIALYQFKGFPESGLDKYCDIWVMEEEGSWIKQFSVGPIPCRAFQQGVWKNGELLFLKLIQASYDRRYVFQLVLYNPCTRELRYLGPAEDFIGYQALVYHESLVSVNGTKGKLSDSSVILQ
ncbi:putative F-box protein At2g02030 [Rhododendron vialii]|uniref:putative F-box protein At2g02030 n=1 Tax=Rhododendron vialii TaxID=182163 RepID=UPI00265F6B36|nr:putative F-box protein At2g02030 [Rhododendron vialii]